ncbi:MAG: hypothetical protein ACOX7K_03075 [Oscillospiraceae bacterium]|jgi:hypothetical protein
MDKRTEKFFGDFQSLSPEWQAVFVWMIQNIDLVDQLVDSPSYDLAELEADLKTALERRDYLLADILLYKREADKQRASEIETE